MEWRKHACFCPPFSVMNNLAVQGPRCREEMLVMERLDIYGVARSTGLRSPDRRACRRLLTRCAWPALMLCFYLHKKKASTRSSLKAGSCFAAKRLRSLAGPCRRTLHQTRTDLVVYAVLLQIVSVGEDLIQAEE